MLTQTASAAAVLMKMHNRGEVEGSSYPAGCISSYEIFAHQVWPSWTAKQMKGRCTVSAVVAQPRHLHPPSPAFTIPKLDPKQLQLVSADLDTSQTQSGIALN